MITKKCRQCGKEFTLSDGEIDFFKSKGLELPSRCADCRKKNKAAGNTPAADGQKRPIVAVVVVLYTFSLTLIHLVMSRTFLGAGVLSQNVFLFRIRTDLTRKNKNNLEKSRKTEPESE